VPNDACGEEGLREEAAEEKNDAIAYVERVQDSAAQQNDKRTDVMLYDGVPVKPVEAGVQSSMYWHLVKSADTAAQADANEHPWSHEDIQSINNTTVKLWEWQPKTESWDWHGDASKGGAPDQLNPAAGGSKGYVLQSWYAGDANGNNLKRIQIVIGEDSSGHLIKAWTAKVWVNTPGAPRYEKCDACTQ
jgi:hypothetical protein